MVAIAATNSATPSLQTTLIRSRLEQARRQADQAEAYAEELRTQADEQERVVVQARQQVNTLENGSRLVTSGRQTSTNKIDPVAVDKPTYIGELAGVFQFAKPILQQELSVTQKSIVTGSLFQAANVLTSTDPASSQAIQRYGNQVVEASDKALGQVLDATA